MVEHIVLWTEEASQEAMDSAVAELANWAKLIRQPKPITDRQFVIEFLDSGVEAFAFTFG